MTPKEEAAPKVTTDPPLPALPPVEPPSLPSITTNDLNGNGPHVWSPQLATWPADSKKIIRQPMTLAHLSALLAALPEETQEALLGPFLADVEPVMTALESERSEHAKARADNRSLDERLYAALKDSGEAEADSSFALQALAALRTDTADERLIDAMVARTDATRKVHLMVRSELLETAEAERDALAAKLGRAMAIVDEAVRLRIGELGMALEQCDFIDRDGRRLETAGKGGA